MKPTTTITEIRGGTLQVDDLRLEDLDLALVRALDMDHDSEPVWLVVVRGEVCYSGKSRLEALVGFNHALAVTLIAGVRAEKG